MTNLREARTQNIEKFIKEHEVDSLGDLDRLNATIKRPAQETEKATHQASPQDAPGD